jgi:hypothetical protein
MPPRIASAGGDSSRLSLQLSENSNLAAGKQAECLWKAPTPVGKVSFSGQERRAFYGLMIELWHKAGKFYAKRQATLS